MWYLPLVPFLGRSLLSFESCSAALSGHVHIRSTSCHARRASLPTPCRLSTSPHQCLLFRKLVSSKKSPLLKRFFDTRSATRLGGQLEVRTLEPVPAGADLCVYYIDLLQGTAARRRELLASKHFLCKCTRYLPNRSASKVMGPIPPSMLFSRAGGADVKLESGGSTACIQLFIFYRSGRLGGPRLDLVTPRRSVRNAKRPRILRSPQVEPPRRNGWHVSMFYANVVDGNFGHPRAEANSGGLADSGSS